MLRKFLIVLLFLTLAFTTVAWSLSSETSNQENICSKILSNYKGSPSIAKSDYKIVREILSASDYVDNEIDIVMDIVEKVDIFGIVPSKPLGLVAKTITNVTKGLIYIEDGVNTYKEIQNRVNEVLNSSKLVSAADYPEVYDKFKKYVKTSLWSWIPDRDYPEIGYLPKELLFSKCLGEKEITKYWPEATKEEQEKYFALTFDELILNYELVWNELLKQS